MILVFVMLCLAAASFAQSPCEQLRMLSLPQVAITAADTVPAGPYLPPRRSAEFTVNLATRCRVTAVLAPSSDSHIEMELWLPIENWNGKFEAVGNGGWSGAIQYQSQNLVANSMVAGFTEGYAVASTDRGLRGGPQAAVDHPEKLVDFGYRAVHETVVTSKTIISAFYGSEPEFSYWNGCSSGGQEGLMEAQRYPDDFDGIAAGAPANYWTPLMVGGIWNARAISKGEPGYMTPEQLLLLHKAVIQACDALDGVKDGLLEDPTRCKFDPQILQCKGADSSMCLTPAQVSAVGRMYAGPVNPTSKEQILPGIDPGSELNWSLYDGPVGINIQQNYFRFLVFQDPSWDYRKLDFNSELARADRQGASVLNATNPNLQPFFDHGGKLLQYHGWSDETIPPLSSVHYYTSVLEELGGPRNVDGSYRLFMVPGMSHCGQSDGFKLFNPISALERWRESDIPPDEMTSMHVTNGVVDSVHLVCPYPSVATYKGKGSVNDAANFTCKVPSPN